MNKVIYEDDITIIIKTDNHDIFKSQYWPYLKEYVTDSGELVIDKRDIGLYARSFIKIEPNIVLSSLIKNIDILTQYNERFENFSNFENDSTRNIQSLLSKSEELLKKTNNLKRIGIYRNTSPNFIIHDNRLSEYESNVLLSKTNSIIRYRVSGSITYGLTINPFTKSLEEDAEIPNILIHYSDYLNFTFNNVTIISITDKRTINVGKNNDILHVLLLGSRQVIKVTLDNEIINTTIFVGQHFSLQTNAKIKFSNMTKNIGYIYLFKYIQ